MDHKAGAITFDFHNTLVHCDAWFDLEVRHLASAFLEWRATRTGTRVASERRQQADDAYRRLRQRVINTGQELSAVACVGAVLGELGEPVDETEIAAGVECLMRPPLASVRLVDGASDTVRAIAAAGVTLGVVSSAVYHPFLEWSLERLGLRDPFASIVTSASAGFYKSRPDVFWHAAEALGAPPRRVVHVGDSYRYDVEGSRGAGLTPVWLRPDAGLEAGADPSVLTLATLDGSAPAILRLLRSLAA